MPISRDERSVPLRVLLITARADHGGGPRHILDLLRAFKGRDITFYIGSPNQEPYAEQFMVLTKKFFEIPPQSFSPFALFRLRRVVKRARVDVIHSHGRGAGLYSRLLALMTGVRVLHTFHGIHRAPSVAGRLKLLMDQILAFFPFTPIFVSENERMEAGAFHCVRPGHDGFIIENAVDTRRFQEQANPPFEHSGSPLRIGAFTRPDLVKGPDLLLSLAFDLAKQCEWSCAGISREELAAYGKIPDSLEVMGRITEPAEWLHSLDIFVSTARNEGLPLGVLEAMAAGRICILSDISAHRSFSKAALFFNPGDSHSFQLALSRLQRDVSLRNEILRTAEDLITSRHSLTAFADKLETAYRG